MELPTRSLTDIYESILLLHARGRAPELIGAFAVAAAQANMLGPVKLERKHDWIRLQFATGETISFDGADWRHGKICGAGQIRVATQDGRVWNIHR